MARDPRYRVESSEHPHYPDRIVLTEKPGISPQLRGLALRIFWTAIAFGAGVWAGRMTL